VPVGKCPICGGELVQKQVEKLLRGGGNTASIQAPAEVCLRCGERLYHQETVRRFTLVRRKPENQKTPEFQQIGQSYKVE
jgi:YgiT-type zinc finger domain-containing protein